MTYTYKDIGCGMTYTHEIRITSDMVNEFAKLTGDTNPIHLDDEIAEKSIFKRKIVHGLLSVSLFSTVLGTQFPGPGTIILNIDEKFIAPVYVGDKIRLRFEVIETIPAKKKLIIKTICENLEGNTQIIGKVTVLFDK